jgi:hypothetical protein
MGKNRIVSQERAESIIQSCLKDQTHFICHKSSINDGGNVACRGFFDKYKNEVLKFVLAEKLGLVEEVEIEGQEKLSPYAEYNKGD